MTLQSVIIYGNFNPIALRRAKIAYNFGLSECSRVKENLLLKLRLHDYFFLQ